MVPWWQFTYITVGINTLSLNTHTREKEKAECFGEINDSFIITSYKNTGTVYMLTPDLILNW